MVDKVAIKKETLDRLGANFQESRGIADKLTLEQMIEYAAQPPATGENKFAQLIERTLTEIMAEDLAGVTKIGDHAFYNNKTITNITIASSVKSIEASAFYYCENLTGTLILPDSVTSIGDHAFYFSNYSTIKTYAKNLEPNSLAIRGATKNVDIYLLSNTFESVTNPWNLAKEPIVHFNNIDDAISFLTIADLSGANTWYLYAGDESEISLTFNDTITELSKGFIRGCRNIKSIKFNGDITSVGTHSFYGCQGLLEIDFTNCTQVPTLAGQYALNGIRKDCQIKVPASLYEEWINATNWSIFASKIVAV